MRIEVYLLIALVLGMASVVLLIITLRASARAHYMTQDRFGDLLNISSGPVNTGFAYRVEYWFNRLGLQRVYGAALRAPLDEAGIIRPELRAIAHGFYVLSPVLFALLAGLYMFAAGRFAEEGASGLAMGGLFGYFVPRYTLRYMSDRRKRALADETLVMIRLLQMLFEAGLSIEQSLRTLREQAGILLPYMRHELDRVVKRIEAGMDRIQVLEEWSNSVGVREVSDLAEMLSQLMQQGGNVQKSLTEMVVLMEDRSRTELREKVGKLSGRMTVVMVLFLFPALMIVVAGPGIMSLTSALGSLR
jgi:tight adherence protein C